jgi:hypothetical protein
MDAFREKIICGTPAKCSTGCDFESSNPLSFLSSMLPLDPLTCETFTALAGQIFTSGEVSLTLHIVKKLGNKHQEALRDPFSLLFHGPQGLRLGQGIYRLKNECLGELEIFITQVADGPKGSEFEAIFT